MILGERLKKLCKERNLTEQQLANAIGYTQRTISSWIKGKTKPKATPIIRCAKYFGVSTDYLLGLKDR